MSEFAKYERMRDLGATPEQICRAAKADTKDDAECIRCIRQLHDLSLLEAKKVLLNSEGTSLEERQGRLRQAVEQFLTDEEHEPGRSDEEQNKPNSG